MTDFELLRAYITRGEEDAFTEVVNRHLNLVYSAALRQTPDAQTAAEIAQTVFIILARKAGSFGRDTILPGWLLRTTHYTAANARRREQCRQEMEQRAMEHLYATESQSVWNDIAPLLDEALVDMPEKDRDLIALRFFAQQSYREIGVKLACSEESARKRVVRAMDKLRALLAKRGKLVAAGAVGSAISSHGITAAPADLASSAARVALAKGALAVGSLPSLVQATLRSLKWLHWRGMAARLGAVSLAGASVFLLYLAVGWSHPARGAFQTAAATPQSLGESSRGASGIAGGVPNSAAPATNVNTAPLHLRVLDADDQKPVANVRLTLVWVTDFPNRLTNVFFTDAKGESLVSIDRTPAPYWNSRIEVFKDGYVPKYVSWSASQGDAIGDIPQEYTTKLTRGTRIGGLVLSEQGQSVSGARVVFTVSGEAPGASHERERLTMMGRYHTEVTDAQGRWRCDHVPAQFSMITYRVFHPDYVTASFGSAAFGATTLQGLVHVAESALREGSATFVLKPGLVVTGVVTDESGNPVPSAKVTENRDWYEASASQFTGTDGRFRFANFGLKPAVLTVQAGGFAPKDLTIHPAAAQPEMRLALSKGGPLRGQVVEQDGTPVANAEIQLAPDDSNNSRAEWKAKTDEQGNFEWLSAPVPKELYAVQAPGHSSEKLELTADGGPHVIKVRKEGAAGPTSFTISGTVVDAETKRPIEKFQVLQGITERGTQAGGGLQSASFSPEIKTRGKSGQFSFETEGSAAAYLFEARADGYWPSQITNSGPLTADRRLEFELSRAADIAGAVQLPDGTPVRGAVAILCGEHSYAYMQLPGEFDLARSGHAQHIETDAQGRFSFKPELGLERVCVAHQAGYAEATLAELTASPVITLKPWGRVEGTLKIGNRAGSNETVLLQSWNWRFATLGLQLFRETTTDADGHFAFDGVPPGERELLHRLNLKPGKTKADPTDFVTLRTAHSSMRVARPWCGVGQEVRIFVEPGQATHVAIGGSGRTVVGAVRSLATAQPIDWQRDLQKLFSKAPVPSAPKKTNFASDSDFNAAQTQWLSQIREFWLSDAGRQLELKFHQYVPIFDTNGSFRIDDVLPGTYTLSISISDPAVPGSPFGGKLVGSLEQEVIVPEADSGADPTPIDLGALELQPTAE